MHALISYARQDDEHRERLETALAVLRSELDTWTDRRIQAGEERGARSLTSRLRAAGVLVP